jgi:ABC-type transporter Mla subunit MlaD
LAFPPAWLDHRQAAYAVFADVGSLAQGAAVRENGYVVGHVVSIAPDHGAYLVRMRLHRHWHPGGGRALAIDDVNPLRAADLAVARVCTAPTATAAKTPAPALCCPGPAIPPPSRPGEEALASCGRMPSLIDAALTTIHDADAAVGELRKAVGLNRAGAAPQQDAVAQIPALVDKAGRALTSITGLADKVALLVDARNRRNLSATLGHLNSGSKSIDSLVQSRRADIDMSVTDMNSILHTTATTLPAIIDNLQRASANLRAVSAEVRNEPTSLLRLHRRSDPGFVAPASSGR